MFILLDCFFADLNIQGSIGIRLTIDQIAFICKPVLQARRFGSISELATEMRAKFPSWFVFEKTAGETFVKRLKWVSERLGSLAWEFLRKYVRTTEGKGVFNDSLVCNPRTLLPVESSVDEWRHLNQESQLVLYKRLHYIGSCAAVGERRTIGKKEFEKVRIGSITFYHMNQQLQQELPDHYDELKKAFYEGELDDELEVAYNVKRNNLQLVDRFSCLIEREKDKKMEEARRRCEVRYYVQWSNVCFYALDFLDFSNSFLFFCLLIFFSSYQELKEEEDRKKGEVCQQLKEQAKELEEKAKNLAGEGLSDEALQQIEEFNAEVEKLEAENITLRKTHETLIKDARVLAVAR